MQLRFSIPQFLGVIALMLSLVSVLYTFQYSWNQAQIRVCNAVVGQELIKAIQARDKAILTLAQSNREVVAGQPSALQIYDSGLKEYLDIINQSPLPDDRCLYH